MVARHHDSASPAFNADETRIHLVRGNGVFLDGRTYEPLYRRRAPLPRSFLRWHPTDPQHMLFISRSAEAVGLWNPEADTIDSMDTLDGYDLHNWGNDNTSSYTPDGRRISIRADRLSDGAQMALVYDFELEQLVAEVEVRSRLDDGATASTALSPDGRFIAIEGCVLGHLDSRCMALETVDLQGDVQWRELGYHVPGREGLSRGQLGNCGWRNEASTVGRVQALWVGGRVAMANPGNPFSRG